MSTQNVKTNPEVYAQNMRNLRDSAVAVQKMACEVSNYVQNTVDDIVGATPTDPIGKGGPEPHSIESHINIALNDITFMLQQIRNNMERL